MVKLEKVMKMRDQWVKKEDGNSKQMVALKTGGPVLKTKGFNFPQLQKPVAPLYTSDHFLN
jgi:hypothetical protein